MSPFVWQYVHNHLLVACLYNSFIMTLSLQHMHQSYPIEASFAKAGPNEIHCDGLTVNRHHAYILRQIWRSVIICFVSHIVTIRYQLKVISFHRLCVLHILNIVCSYLAACSHQHNWVEKFQENIPLLYMCR